MLSFLIALLGVIVTILLVIGIHEFGHFIVARWCGIKVLRFSLGFGKPLFRCHDKKGTEYVLAAIPLGGYIKMVDEGEEDVPAADLPYAFNRQPLYKRMAVIIAGPLSNLIFAIFIYWILFIVGFTTVKPIIGSVAPNSIAAKAGLKPLQEVLQIDKQPVTSWYNALLKILLRTGDTNSMQMETKPLNSATSDTETHTLDLSNWRMNELKPDPLDSFGITPYQPEVQTTIGVIKSDSPASRAGLKMGDKIIAINKQPIKNWIDLVLKISSLPDQTVSVRFIRKQKTLTMPVLIGSEHGFFQKPHGYLGIGPVFIARPDLLRFNQYGPIDAILPAFRQMQDFVSLNFIIIGKMLTGKMSVKSLGGPITIFESAGTALNQGLIPFLSFLAFLSISIGIINIIPIPGLDGGHVLMQTIEFIIRRPLSERVQLLCYRLGLTLLLILIIQAIVNDFMRL